MGSSKTGSLDKFAAFSPAAALASGKVKLPETGIVGMLQAKQEDKMNQGAQMAQQDDDQMAQYMQMMQQQSGMNMGGRVGFMDYKEIFNEVYLLSIDEGFSEEEAVKRATEAMQNSLGDDTEYAAGGRVGFSEGSGPDMDRVLELEEQGFSYEEAFEKAMQERLDRGYAAGGPVESMNFLKQHLPYQDGGHVALRRKMFKLGGPVNTHGIGITSGLEYRNNYNAGGSVQQAPVIKPGPDGKPRQHAIIGGLMKAILGRAAIPAYKAARTGSTRPFTKFIAEGTKGKKGFSRQLAKRLRQAELAAITAGGPAGIAGAVTQFLPEAGDDAPPIIDFGRDVLEGTLDLSPIGLGYAAGDKLFTKPSEYEFETLTGKPSFFGGDGPAKEVQKQASKANMTVDQLAALNKQENQARMQAAMEQYAELLAGSDDTNKLATLGDALIAGGSALMEGEGYGAAGRAFNEPLSASRRSKEERSSAANQAAAQLAISENMQIDAEQRGIVNEFLKTGSFSDAEANQLYSLAVDAGVQSLVPEDDGELDGDTLVNNPGVYADPKNLLGGGQVFVAVDSNGNVLPTNDPKEAKAHAAS